MTQTVDALGHVVAVVPDVGVDDEQVARICARLSDHAEDIEGGTPAAVPRSSYGVFRAATLLALHSGLAHRHLTEGMHALVASLSGQREAVQRAVDDLARTDEEVGVALQRLARATDDR